MPTTPPYREGGATLIGSVPPLPSDPVLAART